MRIATPFHEDTADFTTTALICTDCAHEMTVVGPVPADARCQRCGGATLVRLPANQTAANGRRAA